jgi:hypothetical protein
MPHLRSLAAPVSNAARLTAAVFLLIASLSFPASGDEIVTGPGPGGAPEVRAFDPATSFRSLGETRFSWTPGRVLRYGAQGP